MDFFEVWKIVFQIYSYLIYPNFDSSFVYLLMINFYYLKSISLGELVSISAPQINCHQGVSCCSYGKFGLPLSVPFHLHSKNQFVHLVAFSYFLIHPSFHLNTEIVKSQLKLFSSMGSIICLKLHNFSSVNCRLYVQQF